MAPSGHRRNLQPKSSSEIFSRNLHPCRSTGDSLYKFGRTKHCSVRYKMICMHGQLTSIANMKHAHIRMKTLCELKI